MKRSIMLLLLSVLMIQSTQAQPGRTPPELQLYITGGMKLLHPKYFGHTANISPASVPTIGGGALWPVRRVLLGGEFNYTDGKKHTDEFGTIFTGINFNLLGGYHWNLNHKLKFSIQSGFGYSLYHLSLTDKTYHGTASLNTAIYHNLIYTVPLSIMLQHVNANGTFVGVRTGYTFNVIPNTWRYMEGATTKTYTSGTDGFYFQLVFGGMLNLKPPGQ